MQTEGASYKFRIRARNQIGFSAYSSVFSILAAVVPDEPTSFIRDENSTTENQVAFTWSAPLDDGANSVIDYSIEMDDDNDPFELCVGDPVLCTLDKVSWVSSGSTSGGTFEGSPGAFEPGSDDCTISFFGSSTDFFSL